MSYGKLTVITGPMFSGKTTEILKRILQKKNETIGKPTLFHTVVYKPFFDDRYADLEIVSHDGMKALASILTEKTILSEGSGRILYGDVFIDEIQFFEPPFFNADIIEKIRDALARQTNVTVNGLNLDWQGKPFNITAQLLAMADEIIHLHANCTVCGNPAFKTYKKKSVNSDKIELGSSDKYEARCNFHWSRP